MPVKTFQFRLYPNKAQRTLLMQCLIESRGIYNEMLKMVKQQYAEQGTFPTKSDLERAFKGQGEYVPATTIQCLADRLTKAFQRFFVGRKLGLKVGFPRFKKPNCWHSIQLRQYGDIQNRRDVMLMEDGRYLFIPRKLGGPIKIKLHRPITGIPKTAHLVLRADGHWYIHIMCETESQTQHDIASCEHPAIGIDVGLKSFLTDSEGNTVENPRFYRMSQKTLRRKQRMLCRRKKGSHRRRKAARNTAKSHLKIKRQRSDFHFKVAKQYAEHYHCIAVEDLTICNMVKNHHLAKSISDAGWGQFLEILSAKAASAGHQVIRVNPRFTTQACSNCGELIQKSLSVRTHLCTSCGYVADRDVNAAKNILLKAGAPPSGVNVSQ